MKALEITISGSYRSAKNEVFDFNDIKGVIPYCDEERMRSAVIKRYAYMWLMEQNESPHRVISVRDVYIDNFEVTDKKFSFVGKNLINLSFEELQDVAVVKNLLEIPRYKSSSLSHAITKTYGAYAEKINGRTDAMKETKKVGFNVNKAPVIIIDGDSIDGEDDYGAGVDDLGQIKISMEELKAEADLRGIKYHPNIGHEKLYEKVFADQAVA